MVSVDAKKKELVGQFKNGGRDYRPAGSPVPVNAVARALAVNRLPLTQALLPR